MSGYTDKETGNWVSVSASKVFSEIQADMDKLNSKQEEE